MRYSIYAETKRNRRQKDGIFPTRCCIKEGGVEMKKAMLIAAVASAVVCLNKRKAY